MQILAIMNHKTDPYRTIIHNPRNVPEWIRGSDSGQRIRLQLVTSTTTTTKRSIL